jgi:hypothetical protein
MPEVRKKYIPHAASIRRAGPVDDRLLDDRESCLPTSETQQILSRNNDRVSLNGVRPCKTFKHPRRLPITACDWLRKEAWRSDVKCST